MGSNVLFMKEYYAYIRVSTQKQGQKGVSLIEQREAIERYASREHLVIKEWLEERVTAAKTGRPVFGTMIRNLKKRKACGVIIHKIDRSARNLKDWAMLGEMIDEGIDVHFTTENLDLTSRGGRLSADLQAVVAADYIRNLREETLKGIYGRLKQGLYPFCAPFGYLNNGGGQLKTPDPERAPLIREAFELYGTGNYTLASLATKMRVRGLRSKSGQTLSAKRWSKVFNNSFYVGIIRLLFSGETFQGLHEPLVSSQLFERVQRVLKGRSGIRVARKDFLFRRMLRCKTCKLSLIAERQKGFIYYRCHSKTCKGVCVREDVIDAHIADRLEPIEIPQSIASDIRALLPAEEERMMSQKDALLKTLLLRKSNCASRLERLTDALIDGLIDKCAHEERRGKLLFEQNAISQEIRHIEDNPEIILQRVKKNLELWESLYSSYISGNLIEKRELLSELTSNCQIFGKSLLFKLSEPVSTFEKARTVRIGDPFRDEPRTFLRALIVQAKKEMAKEAANDNSSSCKKTA